MPTNSPEQILSDYRQSLAAVQDEQRQRDELMISDEYLSAQAKIDALRVIQETILNRVPDSSEEHEADKQELIAYMQESGEHQVGEFKAKGRRIRNVDVRAVLEAMQGDIDNLMLVSSIKMKDLEEFAKSNPEYKKDLRSCIVEQGYKVTDIELSTPSS